MLRRHDRRRPREPVPTSAPAANVRRAATPTPGSRDQASVYRRTPMLPATRAVVSRRAAGRRETSRPSEFASRTPWFSSSRSRSRSRASISVPDHLPRLRPPEDVLGEDRQHRVRRVDEPRAHLLPRRLEQHPLVRHPGAVVDAVVDREPVAEVLEHRAARRARDQPEARDDQPLEEDLHEEDLLLEQVGLEEHVRELVEVRVALPLPADLADQPQPRLGVARLVLHHRRVVEARLRVGRRREQLRRHLAREDVGLQLLHDHRAPDVATARLPLGRPLPLRHERDLAPRHVVHLPLLVLREVVEAEDAGVFGAVVGLRGDGIGAHPRDLILRRVLALVFSYEVRDAAEFERVYGTDGEWAEFFRRGRGYIGTELLRDVEAAGPLPRHRPLGVGGRLQRVRGRASGGVHAPRRRDALPLRQRAPLRHVRDAFVTVAATGRAFRSEPRRLPRNARQLPLERPHRAGDNPDADVRGGTRKRRRRRSSPRASATSPAASRRRRSSSPAPTARASGTSTAASSSTSPAASPARTSATAPRPWSPPSTSRSTATSTSASWSGCTSRTSGSAAGSTSSGPRRHRAQTKSILLNSGRRGGRERGQDRPRRDRPARRRRLRPRLPRPHEPDDGDDGEARLQAGLRAARDGRLPRRRALPVPRRLDRGRAREPRPPLQAGRRPELGRVHRARAGAGRGRLHPDAARVRAGAAPHLRRARDPLRRRRGAGGLRAHRARCGRSSSSASSRTCSCAGRRSAAACRSPPSRDARS